MGDLQLFDAHEVHRACAYLAPFRIPGQPAELPVAQLIPVRLNKEYWPQTVAGLDAQPDGEPIQIRLCWGHHDSQEQKVNEVTRLSPFHHRRVLILASCKQFKSES